MSLRFCRISPLNGTSLKMNLWLILEPSKIQVPSNRGRSGWIWGGSCNLRFWQAKCVSWTKTLDVTILWFGQPSQPTSFIKSQLLWNNLPCFKNNLLWISFFSTCISNPRYLFHFDAHCQLPGWPHPRYLRVSANMPQTSSKKSNENQIALVSGLPPEV